MKSERTLCIAGQNEIKCADVVSERKGTTKMVGLRGAAHGRVKFLIIFPRARKETVLSVVCPILFLGLHIDVD